MRRGHWLLVLCTYLLNISSLYAVEIPATVHRVVDGDTIRVHLIEGIAPFSVRLKAIDTPNQPWRGEKCPQAQAATASLQQLLPADTPVTLWHPSEQIPLDRYNRLLAYVRLKNGDCASLYQISQGWSIYWRRFTTAPDPLHQRLQNAQAAAHSEARGLWASDPLWMMGKLYPLV